MEPATIPTLLHLAATACKLLPSSAIDSLPDDAKRVVDAIGFSNHPDTKLILEPTEPVEWYSARVSNGKLTVIRKKRQILPRRGREMSENLVRKFPKACIHTLNAWSDGKKVGVFKRILRPIVIYQCPRCNDQRIATSKVYIHHKFCNFPGHPHIGHCMAKAKGFGG